jgi:hypothetical protein
MIPLSQLPSFEQTRFLHDEFVFTSRNRKTITVDDLSILIEEDDADKYIITLPKDLPEGVKPKFPFYLQHTDLFYEAQKLFEDLFKVEVDVIILHVYKEDKKESACFFSNKQMINNALGGVENVFPISGEFPDKQNKKKQKEIAQLDIFNNIGDNYVNKQLVTLPKGLYPIIGFYNNLQNDPHPSFNLLFSTNLIDEFIDQRVVYNNPLSIEKEYGRKKAQILPDAQNKPDESKLWKSSIDSFILKSFKDGIPLYNIDRFSLYTKASKKDYHPEDIGKFYLGVIKECKINFTKTIQNLLLAYNNGNQLELNSDEFIAAIPHFYNIDRTKTTIELKEKSKIILNSYLEKAKIFVNKKTTVSFSYFIDYFIKDSIITFKSFEASPATEIKKALTEKSTIKNLIGPDEIISTFLKQSGRFEDFLNDQMDAMMKIKHLLK